MAIDRQHAMDAFAAYVAAYDPENPRVALKIAHTHRVASLCDEIAQAEGLNADLAWLCGLLHDIGRFEQVRQYDTFNDSASISHALLGSQVLFGNDKSHDPFIRSFMEDTTYDDLIKKAIETHSDYRLPSDLDEETRAYCNLLRDADKIDIIRVNCICPLEDIYGVSSSDMDKSDLSPAVVNTFYAHRTIPRNIRQYPADILVGHICFVWELVYPSSKRIISKQGFLDQMLSRRFSNAETQETFSRMATHMRKELMLEKR